MKKISGLLLLCLMTLSCADSKEFTIDGKQVTVEPYGWLEDTKNDSVNYRLSTGNIVLSVIFSETVVVPIYLTGTGLYEPTTKK
jgi:hypothetical protein